MIENAAIECNTDLSLVRSADSDGPTMRNGRFGMREIRALATSAATHAGALRRELLAPDAKKTARMFTSTQVALMCGIDLANIKYRVSKGDLPAGFVQASGSRRLFTLPETRLWTQNYRQDSMRPAGQHAVTIAVANFKGGVSKTSTAMVLAQGLSVRGHRVLAIDLDPQGSLTTLHGVLPEADVDEQMTAYPLLLGQTTSIKSAVRKTYWDGLDLVAAATFLYGAEFALPSMRNLNQEARFWEVLDKGLDEVRNDYDIIIIDTSPSLGFITVNALWASDGLLVPIPPSGLDFASSAQFWNLLADLGEGLDRDAGNGSQKTFEFLNVLLSRVDSADTSVPFVREWIQSVYGQHVLPVEIPRTTVTTNQSAAYGTIYDIQKYEGSDKTYRRAFDAYERFVELMEQSCTAVWERRRGNKL